MAEGLTKRWKTQRGYLYVQDDECKGCGFCVEFCPRQVLERSDQFNAKGYYPPRLKDPQNCINCTFCQLICPDFAIWSIRDPKEGPEAVAGAAGKEGTHGKR